MGPGPSAAAGLPEVIPVFPLTGVLLLPRARLPLNVFEPRYLNMTTDALGAERAIGMIQPAEANAERVTQNPGLQRTGCLGRITAFAETDDGRFLITLTGVSRFRVVEELPLHRGYRRVKASYREFARDREAEPGSLADRRRLIGALRAYFAMKKMEVDWTAIGSAPDEALVTSVAMICPLDPAEKQALLECRDMQERAELLTGLLEMAMHAAGGPPTPARH
jgi:Lon protease-like protein